MKFTIVVVNIGQEAAPLLSSMLQVTRRRALWHGEPQMWVVTSMNNGHSS